MNDDLVELPLEDRLLFIGLWCLADREGILEDRPKKIKMNIFPGDDVNVGECLNRLEQMKFIIRYESEGTSLIYIVNFLKHQRPHSKESKSNYRKPQEENKSTNLGSGKHQPRRLTARPDSLIPDTGYLNADVEDCSDSETSQQQQLRKVIYEKKENLIKLTSVSEDNFDAVAEHCIAHHRKGRVIDPYATAIGWFKRERKQRDGPAEMAAVTEAKMSELRAQFGRQA